MKFRHLILFFLFLVFSNFSFADSNSEQTAPTLIYIFRQNIDLNPGLCARTWKIHSEHLADCRFDIAQSEAGIELTKNSLFTEWTYDSTEGWFINFWAKSSPTGFTVTASSEQKIPHERITFEVAQKYLNDLFTKAGNRMLRTVAKAVPTSNANYESSLGELNLFQRNYQLDSVEFINRCLEKAKPTHVGISCVLPLLSTLKGELSADELFYSQQTQFNKGTLGLTIFSERAWAESAAFAPLVFTARWSGAKDIELFKSALIEMLNNFPQKQISLQIYKPGPIEKSSLFDEVKIGKVYSQPETVQFDRETCKANSALSDFNFSCSFALSSEEYLLLENELALYFTQDGQYQIKIERKQNRLIFHVTSENKKVESTDQAIQLLISELTFRNRTKFNLRKVIKVLE